MADCTELALLQAMAARMARINGAGDYFVDIAARVPVQRVDFDGMLDDMPLVGVVLQSGEFVDQGVTPRYADQNTRIELVGCIRRGDTRTDPMLLLLDMKRAAFTVPAGGDAISDCCTVLRADSYQFFLAGPGEEFTQISLYLTARWGDDSLGEY